MIVDAVATMRQWWLKNNNEENKTLNKVRSVAIRPSLRQFLNFFFLIFFFVKKYNNRRKLAVKNLPNSVPLKLNKHTKPWNIAVQNLKKQTKLWKIAVKDRPTLVSWLKKTWTTATTKTINLEPLLQKKNLGPLLQKKTVWDLGTLLQKIYNLGPTQQKKRTK